MPRATKLTKELLEEMCGRHKPKGSGGYKNSNCTVTTTEPLLIDGKYPVPVGTKATFYRTIKGAKCGEAICVFFDYRNGRQIAVYKVSDEAVRYGCQDIGTIDPHFTHALLTHKGGFRQ